jgi:short-subunit dehydrogenase
MKRLMVFGGTSTLAREVCNLAAIDLDLIFLVGRNQKKLDFISKGMEKKYGTEVKWKVLDFVDYDSHDDFIKALINSYNIDTIMLSYGIVGDQEAMEGELDQVRNLFELNSLSTVSLVRSSLKHLKEKDYESSIVVVTSVAGDRGRAGNYYYGASKAYVSVFLSGLRSRFGGAKVNILDIKAGPFVSPMSSGFRNRWLVSDPCIVAKDILRAIKRKKGQIYTPFFWRMIMLIIRSLPIWVFKRISF